MFAFSLSDNLIGIDSLIDNIPSENIPFIEIQGDLAEKKSIISLLSQKKNTVINSYGYVNSNLLTNVVEQKTRLRDEIFDKLHKFINSPIAPEYITLDFGLSYENVENDINSLKIKHMHNLYMTIYNECKKICLPVRFPGNAELIRNILSILRNLMLNRFSICLNIFPHEIANEQIMLDIISGLKYNISLIRLIYEPATGNYIAEKFISFCLGALAKQSLNCPIIFAPIGHNISILEKEIVNIRNLSKSIGC